MRSTAVRRPARRRTRGVLFAVAVAAGAIAPLPARAHLRLGENGLVQVFALADTMLVARSLEATLDLPEGGDPQTPFAPLQTLAGKAPEANFALAGARPPLRYPAGETAVLLLAGPAAIGGLRRSPQAAGARLSLPPSGLSDAGREGLRQLWAATHVQPSLAGGGGIDPDATTAALATLTGVPEPRLRSLAAVEIANLSAHPEHFAPDTRATLARRAAEPSADRIVSSALRVALARLQPAGTPVAAAGMRRDP